MRLLECPACREMSLYPTGIFWACGGCGHAITSAALTEERGGQMRRSHRLDAYEFDSARGR